MLTTDQIQFLYKFCERHYVRYYDVQVELVDHLAAAIEQEQEQDPGLDFTQAVNKVYKGFGITGFAGVVREKMQAEQKKNNTRHWNLFLSFFTIPRIAVTCLVFLLLNLPFHLLNPTDSNILYLSYCLLAAVFGVVAAIYLSLTIKKPKKQLLSLQGFPVLFSVFGIFLQIPNLYFNVLRVFFDTGSAHGLIFQLVVNFFVTALIVAGLAAIETYKQIYKEAQQKYPLAFQ